MHGRRGESRAHYLLELLRVISRPAACASERERRTDDCRIARLFDNLFGLRPRVREAPARHRKALFLHRLLEQLSVFRHANRLALRAYHLDAAAFEHTSV